LHPVGIFAVPIGLDLLRSVVTTFLPWSGENFQFANVQLRCLEYAPDAEAHSAYLDFHTISESKNGVRGIFVPVAVPCSVLSKITPSVMSTVYSETQMATCLQKATQELQDSGIDQQYCAAAAAAVYALAVEKKTTALQQFSDLSKRLGFAKATNLFAARVS